MSVKREINSQAAGLRELIRQSQHAVAVPVRSSGLAQIIAVTSGKGGVGKSNIVVNMALAFARRGYRTIIFDADLGLANADILLGVSPRYNLLHVIRGEKELTEVMLDCPGGVRLIPGGAGVEELANLDDDQRVKFISKLGELEDYADFILVDTGAGINKNVIAFTLAADKSIVITTPEPTSMRDAYGMIKALYQHSPNIEMKLLINMVRDEVEGKEVAERMQMVVSQFLGFGIDVLGYLFADKVVWDAVRQRVPFYIAYPNSYASKCIDLIVDRYLGENGHEYSVVRGKGIKAFMFRLARYFSYKL